MRRAKVALLICAGAWLVLMAGGCAPSTFVRVPAGWKTIELRKGLEYDEAWQITVDTVTRDWDIELLDKNSGYLRTAWHSGISGGSPQRYFGRITVKFVNLKDPTKVEVKTDAQLFAQNFWTGTWYWIKGFDTAFERDVYSVLGGRLGRVVPKD